MIKKYKTQIDGEKQQRDDDLKNENSANSKVSEYATAKQ